MERRLPRRVSTGCGIARQPSENRTKQRIFRRGRGEGPAETTDARGMSWLEPPSNRVDHASDDRVVRKPEIHNGIERVQTRNRVSGRSRPDVRQVVAGVARATSLEEGRAERAVHRAGRYGLRPAWLLRQPDRDAQPRRTGQERTALLEHAYDGALLADALVHPDGAQPPLECDVVHYGRLDRIPRGQRLCPVRERIPLGHPPREWLQHLLPREMAPGAE